MSTKTAALEAYNKAVREAYEEWDKTIAHAWDVLNAVRDAAGTKREKANARAIKDLEEANAGED